MIRVTMTTDLRPLRRLRSAIAAGSADPAFGKMYRQWGRDYLALSRQRFDSKELGGWRGLKPTTIAQRQRQGFAGAQPILRRIGELKAGLTEGAPGNLLKLLPRGVAAGYGGQAVHSKYPDGTGGNISIADLARIHNNGNGRTPRRPIILPPEQSFATTSMLPAARTAFREILAR